MRRAVIDIGTNTVKLLVGDRQQGGIEPILTAATPTRLGEGVGASNRLTDVAMMRTVETLVNFVNQTHALGVRDIIAVATSAVRDAVNRNVFLELVKSKSGLDVNVLSGEREAELIFLGVSTNPSLFSRALCVLDVGGGSAEVIWGAQGRVDGLVSVPLGAVRLTERFGEDGFSDLCEHIRYEFKRELSGYRLDECNFVGTGGTITTLANIEFAKVDQSIFFEESLRTLVLKLNAMSLDERKVLPGLPADRADIIVAGGMVYVLAMEALVAKTLCVSTRGLRYGALVADW